MAAVMNAERGTGITYSAILHGILLIIAIFGLPSFFNREDPEPMVITVDILPISELTNVPQAQEMPKPEIKEEPAPAKPLPNTTTSESKPAEPEPVKKDELVVPDKTIKKKEEKKVEEKKKEDDPLAAILKSVKKTAATTPKEEEKKKPKEEAATTKTKTNAQNYDESQPLSISEKDMIRNQFIQCWVMPAGAKDAYSLAVNLLVEFNPDGSVLSVDIASGDANRVASDTFLQAAAESAIRAVWKCSPLKNLPSDKYGSWRTMEFRFDPKEMLY